MNNIHRQNLLETLLADLHIRLETVATYPQAFVRLAANWLGYSELDEERHFVDGAGDRGIDFWYASDASFEIFQVKSHDLGMSSQISTHRFSSQGVQDIQRAINYLTDENATTSNNSKLKELRKEWEYTISSRRMADVEIPFQVGANLILFGDGLTGPAQQELDSLIAAQKGPITYKDVLIEFHIRLYTIDDVIMARWRGDNREWKDKNGQRRNTIQLTPREQTGGPQWIPGRHNAVFYCRASDLVQAFEDFGYQLFEPNVRAHIRKSRVNDAIKNSLMHATSRREFQYLNNGLTITCKSYTNPKENRPYFRVTEPGIVNGLQTMVALHEAYSELNPQDREHFAQHCYVLVRLLSSQAVQDINKVVLASNTQNPMQARNLRSNTAEQIFYERLFAKLGWFYERKQGAWDAFSSDPLRWRTLPGLKKKHFQVGSGRRLRHRVVDNEQLAQTWLSFIGFSNEAVHNKRFIFEEDYWYELAFLRRIPQHASTYNFSPSTAQEIWTDNAPSHSLMLSSYFAREYAIRVSLSSRENREQACERLGIDPNQIPKEQLDSRLAADDEYLLEQVLSAMSYVFVDFLGYVLFRSVGEIIHDKGFKLLTNGSFKHLKETGDYDQLVQGTRAGVVEQDDILAIIWFAFRHTIDQLMAGQWKQSYQTARNRTRFNHSNDTRTRILRQIDELDKFMSRSQLTQVWAAGIPSRVGLFRYFESILS